MQRILNGRIPGYERPAETAAKTERQLLDELTAKVDTLLSKEAKAAADARFRARLDVRERWTDPNTQTINVPPASGSRVRVSYIIAYCANTSTLTLGDIVLPLPVGLTTFVCGDERAGGIELYPGDTRQLTTAGAAGRMTLVLLGELVPDTQEI